MVEKANTHWHRKKCSLVMSVSKMSEIWKWCIESRLQMMHVQAIISHLLNASRGLRDESGSEKWIGIFLELKQLGWAWAEESRQCGVNGLYI